MEDRRHHRRRSDKGLDPNPSHCRRLVYHSANSVNHRRSKTKKSFVETQLTELLSRYKESLSIERMENQRLLDHRDRNHVDDPLIKQQRKSSSDHQKHRQRIERIWSWKIARNHRIVPKIGIMTNREIGDGHVRDESPRTVVESRHGIIDRDPDNDHWTKVVMYWSDGSADHPDHGDVQEVVPSHRNRNLDIDAPHQRNAKTVNVWSHGPRYGNVHHPNKMERNRHPVTLPKFKPSYWTWLRVMQRRHPSQRDRFHHLSSQRISLALPNVIKVLVGQYPSEFFTFFFSLTLSLGIEIHSVVWNDTISNFFYFPHRSPVKKTTRKPSRSTSRSRSVSSVDRRRSSGRGGGGGRRRSSKGRRRKSSSSSSSRAGSRSVSPRRG